MRKYTALTLLHGDGSSPYLYIDASFVVLVNG